MRPYSGREVVAILAKTGFVLISQRGSHIKLRHPDGNVVIVPNHHEIARGTMRSILRQAGLTPEEFEKLG